MASPMKSADTDDDQQMDDIFDAANEMETLREVRIDDSTEIRNLENASTSNAIIQNFTTNINRNLLDHRRMHESLQQVLRGNIPKIDYSAFVTIPSSFELLQQQLKRDSDIIKDFYRSLFDHNSALQEVLNIVGSFSHVNEARNTWAQFGWVISRFSDQVIDFVPQNYIEANSIAVPYARESLKALKEELLKAASKETSMTKMFEEFEQQDYLLTAMLAFPLIEGNIRRWLLSYGSPGGGNGKLKEKKLDEKTQYIMSERFTALANAQYYFFRYADNFNPEREGECNRHFLMHGMASQEISEEICLKLFLILDETQKVLPRCKALIED